VSSSPVRTGTTSTSVLTINARQTPDISITSTASNTGICSSTPITFSASTVNGGASPQFAWYKNNSNIGANNNVFTSNGWNNLDTVFCVLSSNANCLVKNSDTSNYILMNVENSDGSYWRRRNDLIYDATDHTGAVAFSIGEL
jgi:hypothetical protein